MVMVLEEKELELFFNLVYYLKNIENRYGGNKEYYTDYKILSLFKDIRKFTSCEKTISRITRIYYLKVLFSYLKPFYNIFYLICDIYEKCEINIKMIEKISLIIEYILSLEIEIVFKDSIEKYISKTTREALVSYRNLFKNMLYDPYIRIKYMSDCCSKCIVVTTIESFLKSLIFKNEKNYIKDDDNVIIFDIRTESPYNFFKIKNIEKLDENELKYFDLGIKSGIDVSILEKILENRIKKRYKKSLLNIGIGDEFCDKVLNYYNYKEVKNFNALNLLVNYCISDPDMRKLNSNLDYIGLRDKIGATGLLKDKLTVNDISEVKYLGYIDSPISLIEEIDDFYLSSGLFSNIDKMPYVLSKKKDIENILQMEEESHVKFKINLG